MRSVPDALREASAGLGARKMTTTVRVVRAGGRLRARRRLHPGRVPGHRRDHGRLHRRRRRRRLAVHDQPARGRSDHDGGDGVAGLAAPTRSGAPAWPSRASSSSGIVLFFITLALNLSPTASSAGSGRPTESDGIAMALTTIGNSRRRSRARRRPPSPAAAATPGTLFEAALLGCLAVSLLVLGVLLFDVLTDGWGVYSDRGWRLPRRRAVVAGPARAGISQGIVGSFWIAVSAWSCWPFPLGHRRRHLPRGVRPAEPADRLHRRQHPQPRRRALGRLRPPRPGHLRRGASTASPAEGVDAHAGGRRLTLAVLVLPIMIITTAEAIRAVPQALREARLRRRRHPVGGDPHASAALRGARHPHRHRAVARPGPRRGRAADPGRRRHRFFSESAGFTSATSSTPAHLQERFTALPIDHLRRGPSCPTTEFRSTHRGDDHRHAGLRAAHQLRRHRLAQPLREEEVG